MLQGLVGAWCPSLGPSGYTLLDRSGRGNHGTLTNMDAGSDWVGMPGGWALDFDGTNDYVQTQNIVSISDAITISAWIYRRNNGNHVIADKGNTSNNWILFASGGLRLRGGSSTEITATYTTTNQWSFVCGTIVGTTGTIYIEGKQSATGTLAAVGNTSDVVSLGRYSTGGGGYYINGLMDQITLHSRGLTPTEITQIYNLGRGGLGRLLTQRAQRRVFRTQAAAVRSYLFLNRGQVIGGGTL